MITHHRFDVAQYELTQFFPKSGVLNTNIESSCQQHAVGIIKGWAASRYNLNVRGKLIAWRNDELLTEESASQLFITGKKLVDKPSSNISAEAIEMYWHLLLSVGKTPQVSNRMGMRLNKNTGYLKQIGKNLSGWWLTISTLKAKRTVRLPIKANPHINFASQLVKGALVRQDKRGRWLVEAMEVEEAPDFKVKPKAPRISIDVGLNVLAATSDGRVYGRDVKPVFDKHWYKVKTLRANRQRQGLKENSPKLALLESRLSGFIKTLTGNVANKLVKSYENHVFVVEDLNLSGCRGQKRFAYRALHASLTRKAPCLVVNPAYTSQECPSCTYVSKSNRKGTEFHCRSCGRKSHADVVGAINLLRRSQDKQIDLDDDPSEVKALLVNRHRLRRLRSPDRLDSNALGSSSRKLTVEGIGLTAEHCIASNA